MSVTPSASLLQRADLRTLWLLGDPVSHSMSPLIQNQALGTLDEKMVYLAARVEAAAFESVVRTLPNLGAVGANVTVPHKQRAFEMCDVLSERVGLMRAVNTFHFREDKIFGDNTDGIGWWRAVTADFPSATFSKGLVIGSGGAARAVCHTLVAQGVSELVLLNRTAANAQKLKDELPNQVKVTVEELACFRAHLSDGTLVVQTSSVGLKDETTPVPLPCEWPDRCYLSELIYGRETSLLRSVRALGGAAQDGLGMLCGQAAHSLALWTGRSIEEIPFDEMLRTARRCLS